MLGNRGLLLVEDADLLSVLPFFIKYPHIPLVQRVLKDLIGVGPLGAIGGVDADVIPAVRALARNPPFAGGRGIKEFDRLAFQLFRDRKSVV